VARVARVACSAVRSGKAGAVAGNRFSRVIIFFVLVSAPIIFWLSTKVWLSTGSLRTAVSLVAATCTACILLFSPGFAALWVFERRLPVRSLAVRTTLVIVFSGACHWFIWWVWLLLPTLGQAITVIIWVAVISILTLNPPLRSREQQQVIGFIGLSGFLAVACLGILGVHGGMAVLSEISSGSTYQTADNFFPQQWIERVDSRGDLKAPALNWPLVERPPGQAAWMRPGYWIASNKQFAYEVLGAVLQSLVASAAALMLWTLGIRGRRFAAALVLFSSASFMFFNVVFVWPKLLPAALLILAAAVLIECGRNCTQAGWVAISVAVALSVMAHPGGALAAPAMIVIMWRLGAWPRGKSQIMSVCVAGAAVIAPWAAYQVFYDHGTALILKWHLAGFNDTADKRSFPQVLIDQYRTLTFSEWVSKRWQNFSGMFGIGTLTDGGLSGIAGLRQRLLLVGMLNPMWVSGVLLPIIPLVLWKSRVSRDTRTTMLSAIIGIGLWLVIQFGPPAATTTTFNAPFGLFVLLSVSLAAVAAQILPRIVLALLVLIQVGLLLVISIPIGAQDGCYELQMCLPHSYPIGTASSSRFLIPLAISAGLALAGFALTALWVGRTTISNPWDNRELPLADSQNHIDALARDADDTPAASSSA
jgi:hypothetical protein